MPIEQLRLEADGSLEGHFFHGVNLDDWIVMNNLRVSGGTLVSTEVLGMSDPGIAETYRPIGNVPIDELAAGWVEGNVISPRFSKYLYPAGILNSGDEMVDGDGQPWPSTPGGKGRIVDTAAIEVEFEKHRRRLAPDAPSRLTCIWLADGSDAGRGVIQSMLRNTYICKVRVTFCLRVKVADAGWFDDYLNFANPRFVENYWLGVTHPQYSLPEILIDGVVQLTEQSEIEHIKAKKFKRGMFD